ncbi:MAG: hypothetical protein ACRER4_01320 [Steroidobacteraceae bacterium]
MISITALWLPIIVAAVIVFIASSIIHMAPLWHRSENPKVPNEDRVQDALRPFAIPPGDYMLPRCKDMKDMKSPDFAEKLKRGPVMFMTVMPSGPHPMGKYLAQWFVYVVVVGIFAAYVTGLTLAPGAEYRTVFRIAGATAFIGYAVALWQMSIWYHRAWSTTLKATLDGLIYALLTGGAFGWLWPS